MIKGVIERSRIRKEYLSKPKKGYFRQKQGIKTLEEAQDYTMKLREELIASNYWEK